MSKSKKPWPTKDAMTQIYEKGLWGSNNSPFYSGYGSHEKEIIAPYLTFLTNFLKSFESPLSVCDLGCGDFNIGRHLVHFTKAYKAVDIVAPLIEFNQKNFIADHLTFQCLNIAEDEIPKGDCAIIRQVLQHLSNEEIQKIIPQLHQFKYIILTEHIPNYEFEPNLDIISGQGIRLKKKSGLNLFAPPFNLKAQSVQTVVKTIVSEGREIIETTLITMF